MQTQFDNEPQRLLYEGLDCTVFLNPQMDDTERIQRAIVNDDDNLVLITGHGTPCGLLSVDWKDYIVNDAWADILRQKTVIGIWCYASEFADRNNLHGFFTSMFVSNLNEAIENHVARYATSDNIREQMELFCRTINCFMRGNIPMDEWVGNLQQMCCDLQFVRFNYEALSYFE